ncbi:hypothetical protein [Sinosporangium siamense]|uniref:Uncharacterized protein n=1 Tax=Sinosporangium siamense TaxID=1367973 RepID=A0A919RFV4_9ACTN|nr:hypothetical protein [Sinosporangium siamense]GII92015.1 hypothetical protein Ssi02_22460 [Sinosporangium siamense]
MTTRHLDVREDLAPHAVGEQARLKSSYEWLVEPCREFLAADRGVHYLAHYTGGIFDFALHVLGDPAVAARPGCAGAVSRIGGFQQAGRMMIFQVDRADDYLADLKTGGLIRTVVESGSGAAVCGHVRPYESLVAVTLDPSRVWDADKGMAELIGDIRGLVSLPDEDLGGFRRDAVPASHPLSGDLRTEYGAPDSDPLIERAARLTAAEVGPADLHYLAYYDHWSLRFAVDCFAHPDLVRFFTDTTPEARRAKYAELGSRAAVIAGDFGHAIRLVSRDKPVRIVLDVRQGAIYVRWLDTGRYLVGVTLDQSMVAAAERRLDTLRPHIAALFPVPADGAAPLTG